MPYTVLDPAGAAAAPVTTLGAPLSDQGETLESMREEISDSLGGSVGGVDETRSVRRLNRWINQAYIDIWNMLDLPEADVSLSFSLVADQPLYLLPSIVDTTKGAAIVDTAYSDGGQPLNKIDLEKYRRLPLITHPTTVTDYFRTGNMLVLYPQPASATMLALDFKMRPGLLTEDLHSPILGYEWHEGIMLGARAKAFRALMEPALAASAQNDYVGFLRTRRDKKADERTGQIMGASFPRKQSDLRRSRLTERRHGEEY